MASRTKRPTADDLAKLLDDGTVVRTHVLRTTWHFVSADDIGWLLDVTRPRVQRLTAGANLILLLWFVIYEPLTMRRPGERNGQTWAKQWLGIRVIREDGHPVTAGTAFIRDVLMQSLVFGLVGSFIFNLPTILDGLWPLWDDRNQALHDKVANTFVVDA